MLLTAGAFVSASSKGTDTAVSDPSDPHPNKESEESEKEGVGIQKLQI